MISRDGLAVFALGACLFMVLLALAFDVLWGPYVGACQLPATPQASPTTAATRYGR